MKKKVKTKVCACCELRKKVVHFHKNSAMKDGLKMYCKTCVSKKAKIYRDANYEIYITRERRNAKRRAKKVSDYHSKYYARPEIKERQSKYQRIYKKLYKKKLRKYQKEYYAANRTREIKRSLIYYYKNRTRILKSKRKRK